MVQGRAWVYSPSMALALLLATAMAAAGFLITSLGGFALAGHLHGPLARALVRHHVLLAIPTVLVALFSQSMVIFYFIGTGKLIKDETEGWDDDRRLAIRRALRRLKMRTSPIATYCLISAIVVFVLGGAVHVGRLAPWTHLAAAAIATLLHFAAVFLEYPAFVENAALMADPERFIRGRLAKAPRP
jgi:hypothetical protein